VSIKDELFAEGIVLVGGTGPDDPAQIIMLTWKEEVALRFDAASLELLDTFPFPPTQRKEGWGITYGGGELIVSDGSDVLHFWDPVGECHHAYTHTHAHARARLVDLTLGLQCGRCGFSWVGMRALRHHAPLWHTLYETGGGSAQVNLPSIFGCETT
jgi:hypothetical protein